MTAPPQNLEAEARVLGALLTAGTVGPDVSGWVLDAVRATGLSRECFYFERHALVYDACVRLVAAGRPTDATLVADELERTHTLQDAGGWAQLHEWAALASATANAAHYAEIIFEKARRRDELALALSLQQVSLNGGLDADETLRQQLANLLGFDSAAPIRGRRNESQLEFRPLADVLADVPEEPEWIWHGYMALGSLTLLAGRPKVGKSTLLFGLAAAAIAGQEFLGLPTRPTGILLLSEEREDTLAEKARRFGLEQSRLFHTLMRHEAGCASWPVIVDSATSHCREHDLGLLIVDTWDKWSGLRGDTENSSGHVTEALYPLTLAAAAGLAILVITHQRKSLGEYGEAVRGSNALTGGVDIVVELERCSASVSAEPTARLLKAASRFSATPAEVVTDMQNARYAALGDVGAIRIEAEEQRLLDALEQLGEATREELAELVKLPGATVGNRLGSLVNAGRVERHGRGVRGDPHRWQLSASATLLRAQT